MKILNLKNLLIIAISFILVVILSLYLFTKDSKEISLNSNDFFFNEPVQEVEEPKIVIHIIGEINSPGILYLDCNSRIADAITAAGGTTNIADINKVNLAYELQDGQKIYIPSIYDEDISDYVTDNAGNNVLDSSSSPKSNTININTATQSELESLPGIGKSTATKIIDYRTNNGKFRAIEDIMNVSRNWRKQIQSNKRLYFYLIIHTKQPNAGVSFFFVITQKRKYQTLAKFSGIFALYFNQISII